MLKKNKEFKLSLNCDISKNRNLHFIVVELYDEKEGMSNCHYVININEKDPIKLINDVLTTVQASINRMLNYDPIDVETFKK